MEAWQRRIPLLLALLLVAGLVVWLQKRPPEAEVVSPHKEQLAEVLTASGQVRGRKESRLAPEVSGTVSKILVEEGQSVKAGEIVATLATDRLDAQVKQAEEKVRVARAQLEVASRPPLPSEYAETRSEVERARKVARANLQSAEQRFEETSRGPRQEQIEQARAQVAQASADRAQRERDTKRQEELFRSGAVAKQSYETARTAFQTAQAAEEQARQRLRELVNGSRPEDIAQAKESVRAAQAELQAAQSSGQAKLEQLDARPRAEDVALAQAQVNEALAALEFARRGREQAVLKAPYDGTVGSKLLDPGDPAGPSNPILSFASLPALEIRVELDESERARVNKGTEAAVKASGYPESFKARVGEFAGEIDSVKGTLEVRLLPLDPPEWLLPGQTVDVNLILSREAERLVIPLTSVVLGNDTSKVLVVKNGRIEERLLEVSSPTLEGYLVSSGLDSSDLVVRYPQSFKNGQKVRIRKADFP